MKRPSQNVAERNDREARRDALRLEQLGREDEQASKRIAPQWEYVQTEFAELESEYGELADIWKQLDTKAQITAAAAGVFLGGAFAILRPPSAQIPAFDGWLLIGALGALVLSVVFSFRTLELRKVSTAPRGTAFTGVHDLLYDSDEFAAGGIALQERALRLRQDQGGVWRQVNLQARAILKSKAASIRAAHFLFALGALTFGALSANQILKIVP